VLTIWQTEREPAESGRALLLDGRDPARALSSLERAANDLRAAHLADAAACADARRALALFASGRAADARALIAHLDVPNGPWAEDRLDARIALGQARVRLGDGAGQKLIADARGEAAALGYLGRVFEADWALIESGGAEARARAQSLAAETQAHGFLRLHKLAAKLAQP
jgi:hypothetical protein